MFINDTNPSMPLTIYAFSICRYYAMVCYYKKNVIPAISNLPQELTS